MFSPPAKGISTSMSRFDTVKKRQIIRMRKRTDWFLADEATRRGDADTSGEAGAPFLKQSQSAKSMDDMLSAAQECDQSLDRPGQDRAETPDAATRSAVNIVHATVEKDATSGHSAQSPQDMAQQERHTKSVTPAGATASVSSAFVGTTPTADQSRGRGQASSPHASVSSPAVQPGSASAQAVLPGSASAQNVQPGNASAQNVQPGNASAQAVPTQKQAYCFLLDNFYGNMSLKESVTC